MIIAPRNLATALIVAFLVFREEPVMMMVMIAGLIGLVPFLLHWWGLRKKHTSQSTLQ